jgi:hypothetical protein
MGVKKPLLTPHPHPQYRVALRRIGAFSLFLAFFMHSTLWGMRGFAALKESALSATVIEVPKAVETCPHHLHGCPKDCMCPKTYEVPGEQAPNESLVGVVREPSLVACTEHGPNSLMASTDFFLLEDTWSISFPRFLEFLKTVKKDRLQDWLQEPPSKIPIA